VLSIAHIANKKAPDLPTTSTDVQHDVEICYQKEKYDVKEVCWVSMVTTVIRAFQNGRKLLS